MARFAAAIGLALAISASIAKARVVELTEANYLEKTMGKTVFIKCFAPWCGHCQAMAEDWEKLAADWEDHEFGLVGEVNCDDNPDLCEQLDVNGYPTLLYGNPTQPSDYSGDRDYESLSEFADGVLNKRVCSVFDKTACSDEEKSAIAEMEAMSEETLESKIEEVEGKIDEHQNNFNDEVEKLQDLYEKLSNDFNKQIDEIKATAHYDLMRAVLTKKGTESKDNAKEEL